MSVGIDITLNVLAKTRNEAAIGVLLPALDSPHRAVSVGSLRALLQRRSTTGAREIVRRWDRLPERWKAIINEKPSRISSGIRAAILSPDKQLCLNGLQALIDVREFDLAPTLINAAEDQQNPFAEQAAGAVLRLAETLHDEIVNPKKYDRRREPQIIRSELVGVLEHSLQQFDRHRRREILEAYLLLASRENAVLKTLLNNPHDPAYLAVIDTLTRSEQPGVVRLVLNFLDETHAPSAALNVLSHRSDPVFLGQLLKRIDGELSPSARTNLKRIESFNWLRDNLGMLTSINPEDLAGLVKLVVMSGMNRLRAFSVLKYIAQHENLAGRIQAFQALGEFRGAEANELIRDALDDPEPQIQAAALSQIRERNIPGAVTRLIESLESPHEAVREAARGQLSEFNFKRYLSAFDMLEANVRRSTGQLVAKVDPTMLSQLRKEIEAQSRSRRIRACEAAPYLGAADQLEERLLELMEDPDHFVRAAAAAALGECASHEASIALREALLDRSALVQEAAELALQQMADKSRQKKNSLDGVWLDDPKLPESLEVLPPGGE